MKLDLLHPDSPEKGTTTEQIERQETLENATYDDAVIEYNEKYREAKVSGKDLTQFEPEAWLLKHSINPMAQALVLYLNERDSLGGSGSKRQKRAREFFKKSNPYNLSFITARVCLNQTDERESIQRVCVKLGNAIKRDAEYQAFKEAFPGYVYVVEENIKSNHIKYRQTVLTYNRRLLGIKDFDWSEKYCFTIGNLLLQQFIASTGLFEIHKFKKGRGWMNGIRPTVRTAEKLEKAHGNCALLHPLHQMMRIKPMKWSDAFNGGFYTNHIKQAVGIIKRKIEQDVRDLVLDVEMSEVYDALNALQETPYRINKTILSVMEELRGSGEAGLPVEDIKRLLPPETWDNQTDEKTLKEFKRKKAEIYDAYYRNNAKRTVAQAQLRIAKKFKDDEAFYFCWNMDWRGRVYPLQAHLHPQANDAGKGLLEFANGTRLGNTGPYWLSVYGANCFGEDKVSLDNRALWVHSHIKEIKESAKNPLDFQWWTKADKPFLFLAFCLEWSAYLESGRSPDYVCHLPVQMDGACNGLQHFSAMLRDPVGAKAVSLEPGRIPGDVYAEVAKVSSRLVKEDAKVTPTDDASREIRTMGQLWTDKVTRKWTKRNCMTFVYGASLHGFTEQLREELRKYQDKEGKHYLAEGTDDMMAARYLAKINRKAIGEVVQKPSIAMGWMQKFTRYIAGLNSGVKWSTEAGLPVTQLYKKTKYVRFKTYWGPQKIRMDLALAYPSEKVNTNQMANGIAPNFIHSMDATHLMKTALVMKTDGITDLCFIHDSFGCPAGQVQEMQKILRKTFVELYKGDVLNDWYITVLQQLTEEEQCGWEGGGPPEMGDFDVSKVNKSAYFFA